MKLRYVIDGSGSTLNDGVGRFKRSGTANTATEAGGCATLHPPYPVRSFTLAPLPKMLSLGLEDPFRPGSGPDAD